jgi:glycosyltransferase involved in cell wall biosynthesis
MTGGVELYLKRLAHILNPTVDLYCICILPQTAEDLRAEGVKVTLLPQAGRWTKILGFICTVFVLPYLVVIHRIDCVQVNGFLEAIFLLEARILGRRAIYTRHGPFETDLYNWRRQPRYYFPRWIARHCAHAASALVCVSTGTQESLDESLRPKSIVIPHWLQPDTSCAHRLTTLKNPPRIVCVSRLECYKGIQLVIEAVRSLPQTELWIIGDGSYRAVLEEYAAGLNVRFYGFQSDPSPYLMAADIFIMPSLGPEGSSLAALEAMAHALPCLLSDLTVNQELSDSGKTALHFRCGDVDDLREKLEQLLDDHQSRLHYAQLGYNRVEQFYSTANAVRAYCQVLGLSPNSQGASA